MPARGKFIALEGIDGSGKRTQIEMLARALASRAIEPTRLSFPRYDGFFGRMVGQFLNGKFGPLEVVDPHFSALLYAGDRLEAKPEIEAALAAGKMVLADRYIGSNLAHQGARVPDKGRAEFLKWLKQLEYEVYGLPVEDLVIYLRVPAWEARRLVGQKVARPYTKRRRDLQEANLVHLATASIVYDELAGQPNWVTIECAPATGQVADSQDLGRAKSPAQGISLRAPQAIHSEILRALDARELTVASKG